MFSIIQAAGWTIWPLLLCSVLALAIVVERAISLRPSKITPPGLLDQTIAAHKSGHLSVQALGALERSSLLAQILAEGLRSYASPGTTPDDWDEAMTRAGKQAAENLETRLSALATIASAAPLLGLLGTVVGMIEIFGAHNAVGADPASLAHGISVALYNTAFGLLVAIPALVFWRVFRSRADRAILSMEISAGALRAHLKAYANQRAKKA